jgi:hypothetical protein
MCDSGCQFLTRSINPARIKYKISELGYGIIEFGLVSG